MQDAAGTLRFLSASEKHRLHELAPPRPSFETKTQVIFGHRWRSRSITVCLSRAELVATAVAPLPSPIAEEGATPQTPAKTHRAQPRAFESDHPVARVRPGGTPIINFIANMPIPTLRPAAGGGHLLRTLRERHRRRRIVFRCVFTASWLHAISAQAYCQLTTIT